MKTCRGIVVRKDLVAVVTVTIGGLLLLSAACVIQPATTYKQSTWSYRGGEVPPNVRDGLNPSCLDEDRILAMVFAYPDRYPEFEPIRKIHGGRQVEFRQMLESVLGPIKNSAGEIEREGVLCLKAVRGKSYDLGTTWKGFHDRVLGDHRGLLSEKLSKEKAQAEFECALGVRDTVLQVDSDLSSSSLVQVCTSGNEEKLSITMTDPVSFALSAREAPSEQEPGSVFAGLKERAQAALIEFAKNFPPDKAETRENAIEALLKLLSPPPEPKIVDTRRIELTISSVLNTASVEDRLNYLTAYLLIPPLPGPPNGNLSLEWYLLRRFQQITLPRPSDKRAAYEENDFRLAFEDMRVRVEFLEKLETEVKTFDIGSIKGTSKLDIEAGATAGEGLKVIKIAPSFSSERTENIKMELDKRSTWINPERSLVRVTQRGRAEATISGAVTSALTLKYPKTDLYEIEVGAVKFPHLKQIEQPLYKEVQALGMVLGTIRVAEPARMYVISQREFDGVSFTHTERPVPLRLLTFKRSVHPLKLKDLDDLPAVQLLGPAVKEMVLGLRSSEPLARQKAFFKDHEMKDIFIQSVTGKALPANAQRLKLIKHSRNNWYLIAPCTPPQAGPVAGDEPRPHDIWIGFEDDESDLAGNPIVGLPAQLGTC